MKTALACLALLAAAVSAAAAPVSCFVVHAEPTGVDAAAFAELAALVALADGYVVPLTLLLTAQWADLILADPQRIAAVALWVASGHEIGVHHHAYWATQDRGAQWDGYTNVPVSDLAPSSRRNFLGTMDDFWAALTSLPGERRTGCLGLGGEDEVDWICGLSISISGHEVADAVSRPTAVTIHGCAATQVYHALLSPASQAALAQAFATAGDDALFAVVLHVTDAARYPDLVTDWFDLVTSADPEGLRRMTVRDAVSLWPLP
ncbi:MAG: hypothetical protein AB1778_09280 [Candidatus Bipolaricaulota bacterium]